MTKAKEALASRLQNAIADANAFIDEKAREVAKENPGIPVGVIRQTISRGGNCPCSYALNLLDEESKT